MKRVFQFLFELSFVVLIGVGFKVYAITDTTPPYVEITSPSNNTYVRGTVDIKGYVIDENLSHHNIAIYNYGADVNDFSLRIEQKTEYTSEFSEKVLYTWDTTNGSFPNGKYQIRLAARDLAGNRELNGASEDIIVVTVDNTAPIITLNSPEDNKIYAGKIDLKAICNEDCDYINFWWREENQAYSNVSPDRRYHYEYTDGTEFNWSLNTLDAQRWGGDPSYVMADGVYYMYAAGKDLAGNWAKSQEVRFIVDNDQDNDGIRDDRDLCLQSEIDIGYERIGVNRWIYNGLDFIANNPKGKGPSFDPDMEFTYGCSCIQVLDNISEITGENLEGLYKYGCTKGLLEDWNLGIYYYQDIPYSLW